MWLPLWGENLWITIRGALRGHSVILDFVITPGSKPEWNQLVGLSAGEREAQ